MKGRLEREVGDMESTSGKVREGPESKTCLRINASLAHDKKSNINAGAKGEKERGTCERNV